MRFIKKYNNIVDFRVLGDSLYYVGKNNVLRFSADLYSEKETSLFAYDRLELNATDIGLLVLANNIVEIYNNDKIVRTINFDLTDSIRVINGSKVLIRYVGNIFDDKYNLANPQIKEVYNLDTLLFKVYEWGNLLAISESVILLYFGNSKTIWDYNNFAYLDPINGAERWRFILQENLDCFNSIYSYEKPIGINRPVGFIENLLIFSMVNEGVLFLDNVSGRILEFIRDVGIFTDTSGIINSNNPVLPWIEKSVVFKYSLVCLHTWYYWEIDLRNFNLDFQYLRPYFESVRCVNLQQWKPLIVENDQIIIVSQLTKKFAAFNRQTREYDWIIDLPENCGKPRSIEKHGNRFYIDTFNKELLVYEMD